LGRTGILIETFSIEEVPSQIARGTFINGRTGTFLTSWMTYLAFIAVLVKILMGWTVGNTTGGHFCLGRGEST